ncbi:MAG: GapS6a family protein [Methylovulum sp.]
MFFTGENFMDFLTSTILSGIAYDVIKCGVLMTTDNLKDRLRDWIIDDYALSVLAGELNKLSLTDEMSESAIERKILSSTELISLLENIKPISEGNTIIQSHSGSGDNVGRDKVIHRGR